MNFSPLSIVLTALLSLALSGFVGLTHATAAELPVIDQEASAQNAELTWPTARTTLHVRAHAESPSPNPLTYHWVQVSGPPSARVDFSPNGDASSDTTTATITRGGPGTYTFRVVVSDGLAEAISQVDVKVHPARSGRHPTGSKFRPEQRGKRTFYTRTDRVIVGFEVEGDQRVGPARFSPASQAVLESLGATLTKSWMNGRLGLVECIGELHDRDALDEFLTALEALPEIRYAEADDSIELNYLPNDPRFVEQWALQNPTGVDIDATSAWDQTTGGSTLIAVMDSGIDYTHPDLYLAIAINAGEIPAALLPQIVDTNSNGRVDFYDLNSMDENGSVILDGGGNPFNETLTSDTNLNGYIDAEDLRVPAWLDGVDGDSNGYLDDLTGWDSLDSDSDPMDVYGHGTHASGILAAKGDNGIGIAGVDWQAEILPERFWATTGGSSTDAIAAIDHAVLLGADVINASWGTFTDSVALKDAIVFAGANDVVVVVAAGNQGNDIDNPVDAYYPAAYTGLTNLISVASVDPDGSLSASSNFGLTTVDIGAPGSSVLSTQLGGDYALWSGTSFAVPHVAGTVSLLAALFPNQTADWLVARVLATAAPLPALAGKTVTGGMVDAFAAVNTLNTAGPRVLVADPIGDVVGPVTEVVLTFDSTMTAASFTTADVTIDGPSGPVLPTAVNALTGSEFEVVFASQFEAGLYTLTVGPDIEDDLARPMDQDRDGTAGEALDDQFTVVFNLLPAPSSQTIDNGDAGYVATGGWTTFVGGGAEGDFDFVAVGSGLETAVWTLGGLAPGDYQVSVTWDPFSNRAVDAPYTVLDGSTPLGTVAVDQTLAPADFVEGGVAWQDLGVYSIVGDTLVVELSDLAGPGGSLVVADAVRVEGTGPIVFAPEIQVLVGGADIADGTGSFDFGTTEIGTPVSQAITVANIGTLDLSLGSITLPAGFSLVSGFGSTLLSPGQSTSFVVQMDATAVSSPSGVLSFDSNDANENPFDFTISGTVTALPTASWMIDDGDPGYSATAGWTPFGGVGAEGDIEFIGVGTGAEVATWTQTGLPTGEYRVSATWVEDPNRTQDAPYTVLDGAIAIGTVLVDQRAAPVGFVANGVVWQELGVYPLNGDTLVVELQDLTGPPGSFVIADAVFFERIGDLPVGPEISVSVAGAPIADGTGSVDFGSTPVGTPLNQTITVANVGTTDLTLGTLTLPTDFSLVSGFGSTLLSPGQTTDFVVQMDATAVGTPSGVLSFDSNDADENPFDFTVSGTVTALPLPSWTIDDGDPGYSATAGWTPFAGVGAEGDIEFIGVGTGTEIATWTQGGLATGEYRVYTTWVEDPNRTQDAPYTVLDGAAPMGTVVVDQRVAPVGFVANGVVWQELGVYPLTGDTLVVELQDLTGPPGSFVIADAVYLERIGDLPIGPEISVSAAGVPIADGTGSVDFGTTMIGAPLNQTITVTNVGTTDLTLGTLTLPTDFSLVSGFGTTLLSPGQTTDFVVQMDATALGTPSGVVSFDSNDVDENPFDFTVSGTVVTELFPIFVIDDGDPGYSETAGWTTYNGSGAEGDFDYTYATVGSGDETATWTQTGLTVGEYRVSVTWEEFPNRAIDAPYTVFDGVTPLGTVAVDQTLAPVGFVEGGVVWQDIGNYVITGDTLSVVLSNLASPPGSVVVADAVRIERIGGLPPGPEVSVSVGGAPIADGTGSVDFGTTAVGAPLTRTIAVTNVGSTDLSLGAITLPADFSLVSGFGATLLVTGQTTDFVVQMDAVVEGTPSGVVSFDSNDVDENPFDFTVSGTIGPPAAPTFVIDNGDAGYSVVGSWNTYNGSGAQGDFNYIAANAGAETALWTQTGLAAGEYRVSVTWEEFTNRAVDSPYTVLDGVTPLGTVTVDQSAAPVGFVEDGVAWQDLGNYVITGDTLSVELSNLATPPGNLVIADAVRIEQIGNLPVGPEISVSAAGAGIADGTGSVDFGTTTVGAPLNQTITVTNVGTTDLTLGTLTVPTDFSLVSGFGTTLLSPGQTTDFVVQMDAIAEGTPSGVVSFDSNDADENPFDFTVSGTVGPPPPPTFVIDNGDLGYSVVGSWSTFNGSGAQGDFDYIAANAGAETALWTQTGLAAGEYRVSVTWEEFPNRAVDSPYTVLDGVTPLGTVTVDQSAAPVGFVEDGVVWQDLGNYVITGDTLSVELSNLATPPGNLVIADAVRIEQVVGTPSSPEISVSVAGTGIADGTGSVDFGTTTVGAPLSQTITVTNVGSADLSLGAITLPADFSLVSGFGTTLLSPGQTTDFVVQMDATAEGTPIGIVSFDSNDADENPFDFTVSGTVGPPAAPTFVIDDGDVGYSATAGWATSVAGGAQGDYDFVVVGTGAETATWTQTGLAAGEYRVSVTWDAFGVRPIDAAYAVLDGATELATVTVDQSAIPASFLEDGVLWEDIGVYTIAGDTLVVRLSDLAGPSGSLIVADAVRIENVGPAPTGPEIRVTSGGVLLPDGTATLDFGTTDIGSPVNQTISVANIGTTDLTLGTITLPAEFSLFAGFGSTLLAPGETTDFVVQYDPASAGTHVGVVSFDSDDGDENPYDLSVVPEPALTAQLVVGAYALMGLARRRSRTR